MHSFAQVSASIPVDTLKQNNYLARQIEPKSLKLYGSA
jgi:hypothetical protein